MSRASLPAICFLGVWCMLVAAACVERSDPTSPVADAAALSLKPGQRGNPNQWIRQFGTAADDRALGVDLQGNAVYVVGQSDGSAFVRRLDATGGVVWTRQFAVGSVGDGAFDVAVDGNAIYVVGSVTGTLPGQTGAGGRDAFLRKYDRNGNLLWTRQFGTDAEDIGAAVAVHAGGVYVAGQTLGTFAGQTSAGGFDAYLRKYDRDGNLLWTRQFGTESFDAADGVAATGTGVFVGGTTSGAFPGQTLAGANDGFVRRFGHDGDVHWTRQFGTAGNDGVIDLAEGGGAVYVVGDTGGEFPGQTASGGITDAYVRKYDYSGNAVWTRQFGTAMEDTAFGVTVATGAVYVVGETEGTLPGQTGAGDNDAFLRVYTFHGNELSTLQFGTPAADGARGVAVGSGGIFVAGQTLGTFPGESSAGGVDAFVARF